MSTESLQSRSETEVQPLWAIVSECMWNIGEGKETFDHINT
jgi:hypothetical protein